MYHEAGPERAEKQFRGTGGVSAHIVEFLREHIVMMEGSNGYGARPEVVAQLDLSRLPTSVIRELDDFSRGRRSDRETRINVRDLMGGVNPFEDLRYQLEPIPKEMFRFGKQALHLEPFGFNQTQPKRVTAAQIHAELFAEVGVMEPPVFAEAEPVPSERVSTLRTIGFHEQPEVREYFDQEVAWLGKRNRSEADCTNYNEIMALCVKLPNYKFIKAIALEKVTVKYDLLVKSVDQFIGTIPEKNVQEMAGFVKQLGDENVRVIGKRFEPGKYLIAAPAKEFKSVPVVEFPRWMLDDPIVLYPALDGYFIVTAWGDEASDPDVMNERHN
jgi:hypothetical protein